MTTYGRESSHVVGPNINELLMAYTNIHKPTYLKKIELFNPDTQKPTYPS
jgi:hypothetical protein